MINYYLRRVNLIIFPSWVNVNQRKNCSLTDNFFNCWCGIFTSKKNLSPFHSHVSPRFKTEWRVGSKRGGRAIFFLRVWPFLPSKNERKKKVWLVAVARYREWRGATTKYVKLVIAGRWVLVFGAGWVLGVTKILRK